MKEKEVIKTEDSVQRFMDLFVLEQIGSTSFTSMITSDHTPLAIQTTLEQEVYEDVPLIKDVQKHIYNLVIQREEQEKQQCDFQEEIKNYFNDICMICPGRKTIEWTTQDIRDKWKNYSKHERDRMIDFIKVYQGVFEYFDQIPSNKEYGRRK